MLIPLLATGLLLAPALAPAAAAQDAPRPWEAESELGAAAFFGNTSALTLTARGAVAHVDSTREVSASGNYTYGRATDRDGDTFVAKRSWGVGASLDRHPLARWSPFAFARVESSLEQRIDLRYHLGAGAKHTFVRTDLSMADASLALLAERTDPADDAQAGETLVRWSVRVRGRRSLSEGRLKLATETLWKPNVGDLQEFTLSASGSVAFVLTERVSLKFSFLDGYDSEARARGARSNNDAQLLLGVLSSF